jgi:uncharacterized protein (DUF305 family)
MRWRQGGDRLRAMKFRSPAALLAGGMTLLIAAACAHQPSQMADEPAPRPVVQPGAPGEETRTVDAEEARVASRTAHTEADVRFMRDMIHHHEQAVEMAALVEGRTERPEIHLLARRIELAQRDEIAWMNRWLRQRGEEVPEAGDHPGDHPHHVHHEHHHHGHVDMPGMLTPEQMAQLAAARGDEFDRLFLEGMIHHHRGAIVMVADLFASPGAAQDSDIYGFAAHVDADQQAEIDRMQALLTAWFGEVAATQEHHHH